VNILIDGVFFQLSNTGIARFWRSILPRMSALSGHNFYMLDRGNAPDLPGVTNIEFPAYLDRDAPADSALIQHMCDHLKIDSFTSTYYTTPLETPAVMVVHDMIPERLHFEMKSRIWLEKTTAISYAQRYVCISQQTKNDLLHFYPEIPEQTTTVAHCGVEHAVFRPRTDREVKTFLKKIEQSKPYFLLVGTREGDKGYKNTLLFFKALKELPTFNADILCVGGERRLSEECVPLIPRGSKCRRLELTDEELACAYAGAIALVYPSLYEGFGMPVAEAMACGCPVITTHRGSLAEVSGGAAHRVDGYSTSEMARALLETQHSASRGTMVRAGLHQSQRFNWEVPARAVIQSLEEVNARAKEGRYTDFFQRWKALRTLQQQVD
jgi:glycosyltransferase involved in cell wall biosynthesis